MISVIVPVYNTEKYLDKCIQSILSQTYTDFELLLINDGSTDSSGAICDRYAEQDSRVRVFHQVNSGVTSARKLGVDNAKGEYVSFVDSDDELKQNALSVLLQNISNIDIVVSSIKGEGKSELLTSDTFIRKTLKCEIARGVPGRLFKRSLFTDDIWLIPNYITVGEDELMNLKLSIGRNLYIKCIEDNVYVYRHNLDSVTSKRQFSLNYEEVLMQEYEKALGENIEFYSCEYNYKKLLTLENLIVCKVPVPYNRIWVLSLIKWGKTNKLSFRHWVVLNVRNNIICKYILAVEKRISLFFNK